MKKFFIAALTACASVAAIAADTENTYVSVSVGSSEYKFDGDKQHHTGFGLAFGQAAAENFGYEIGYAHLGKFDGGGSGQALYLAGTGKYAFGQGFDVHGKIGPTINHYSGGGGVGSDTYVRLLLGAGVGYQFDKNWAATLDYTHFGKSAGLTPSLWSVGVQYRY
jgi:hypothetical protein